MAGWERPRIAWRLTALALLVSLSACGGNSGGPPFAGINQTYVITGGNRELKLSGLKGTYTAVTPSGSQSMPVVVGPGKMSVGKRIIPYLAASNLLVGGGYLGFASAAVTSDPRAVPGTYNTMSGANFAGQLSIDSSGNYVWCMLSTISGAGCTDGSAPNSGTIAVVQGGFKFSGVLGTYAVYQHGSAAAIFGVDAQSLHLMALTEPQGAPAGKFSQPASGATGGKPLSISFTAKSMVVSGDPNWNGKYAYSLDGGIVSFPSGLCVGGTCNAIFNNSLNIVYIARMGTAAFIR